MRHILTGLQHTQIARSVAPHLVDWRTVIRAPNIRQDRRVAAIRETAAQGVEAQREAMGAVMRAEADERARARGALAGTVWREAER